MNTAFTTTAIASHTASRATTDKKQVDLSDTLKYAGSSFASCLQGLGLDDWALIGKGLGTVAAIALFAWAILGIFAWTADLANQPSPAAAVYRVR